MSVSAVGTVKVRAVTVGVTVAGTGTSPEVDWRTSTARRETRASGVGSWVRTSTATRLTRATVTGYGLTSTCTKAALTAVGVQATAPSGSNSTTSR